MPHAIEVGFNGFLCFHVGIVFLTFIVLVIVNLQLFLYT